MSGHTEQALVFDCKGENLLGILAQSHTPSDVGVVIIVGGPQYRIGSHRQFVMLARALADAGHSVLRFDYRSMGDASGDRRDFLTVQDDTAAAIDTLMLHCPGVRRTVLWGLCDGASAALLYMHTRQDPRVAGLCLINPWVRSVESLARTQIRHYYLARLAQRDFWTKLLSGKVAVQAMRDLLGNLRNARAKPRAGGARSLSFQEAMAAGWKEFGGNILLLLSEHDYTAKEFQEHAQMHPAWGGALSRTGVTQKILAGADHTFSSAIGRSEVLQTTLAWLGDLESGRRNQKRSA